MGCNHLLLHLISATGTKPSNVMVINKHIEPSMLLWLPTVHIAYSAETRHNNVIMASKRRRDVVLASYWRYYYGMCPFGSGHFRVYYGCPVFKQVAHRHRSVSGWIISIANTLEIQQFCIINIGVIWFWPRLVSDPCWLLSWFSWYRLLSPEDVGV